MKGMAWKGRAEVYRNILVWTQRVKPGFMHALGNTPTLNLVLRGSLDHRTVSGLVGSQNGADPGSLGLSGAPDTGPWTPYPPPPRCSSFSMFFSADFSVTHPLSLYVVLFINLIMPSLKEFGGRGSNLQCLCQIISKSRHRGGTRAKP